MSSLNNTDCRLPQALTNNPDISGVGVRVSFYLQTFLLVLLVDRSWEDAPSALWTFIATSFGLTIAALVQASQDQLNLFQAIQVSNLVWLANFGSFLALASYSRRKSGHTLHGEKIKASPKGKLHKPENYVKFGAMLQTLLSMILTIYLWARAETFGLQCSENIHYVLFAFKAKALGSGRIIALVLTSILTVGYLLVTFHELRSYWRSYQRNKHPHNRRKRSETIQVVHSNAASDVEQDETSMPTLTMSPRSRNPTLPARGDTLTIPEPNTRHGRSRGGSVATNSPSSITGETASQMTVEEPKQHRSRKPKTARPRKKQWSGNWDPMLLGIGAFQVVVFTYFVVSTELLLKWNSYNNGNNSTWGFGQILALIVIVPSALAVFNAFRRHGLKRLHKKRKNPKNKKDGIPMVQVPTQSSSV